MTIALFAWPRKSGWIEVVPFTTNSSRSSLNIDPFLVIRNKSLPSFSWNLPRLIPQRLPVLDLSTNNDLRWINTNVSSSMSACGRALRELYIEQRSTGDPLADLKEEFFTILMHVCGIYYEAPQKVFYLDVPGVGVMSIIFITQVRLEENDTTLVADAHVMALAMDLIHKFGCELLSLHDPEAVSIGCVEESYKLWGSYLAASIERTRDRVHKPDCSIRKGRVKSATIQPFENVLCQCGAGKVSKEFKTVKEWQPFCPFATRCLLAPISPAHAMEQSITDVAFKILEEAVESRRRKD
jgi:hypothetical protein